MKENIDVQIFTNANWDATTVFRIRRYQHNTGNKLGDVLNSPEKLKDAIAIVTKWEKENNIPESPV